MKKPLLSEMTLREKIGQMLAPMQWDVYEKDENNYDFSKSDWNRVRKIIEKEQFGTIRGEQIGVYFADPDNDEEVRKIENMEEGLNAWFEYLVEPKPYREFLTKQAKLGKIPPLVGGDCASGGANAFKRLSSTVSATAIGAADSEELTYAVAASVARELRHAGVNWRWAPVLDLGNRNETACMRTFAMDDPERTVRLAKAYIDGMQAEGVAATAKHFPSLDRGESRDSHFTPLLNSSTMEQWWSEQGKVYQEIIDHGVYSIMIGHQAFPAADDTMINGKYIPSTLSKKVITDLLKNQMGFDGVVITDGIGMASLFSLLPYEELIVGLVNAGNDVILGAKMPSGDLIEQAVLDGRIPESRIDDACTRVLNMKEKLGMFREDYYDDLPYALEDCVKTTGKINVELAKRSITLVRDRQNLLPIDQNKIKKATIIVSTHAEKFAVGVKTLANALRERGIEVHVQRRLSGLADMQRVAEDSDLIIYAAYVAMHAPAGAMRLFGDECKTYYHAFKAGKEKSIGVSFGYPYIHYDTMENADTFINAYNMHPDAMRAFVDAIFGDIEICGKSPVLLEPRANTK